nr:LysM peptidoglycan-binding domain-containing protein [Octadecabacter dasysiphoniae]
MRPIQDDLRATTPAPDTAVVEQAAVTAPVEPVVEAPQVTTPLLPQVTDRRFEPDGAFLVSGVAEPGQPLAVMVDGGEVERVDVGADGSFLVIGFLGYSDAARVMTVVGDPDGAGLIAERTFIFDANPAPVVVVVAEAPVTDPVADPIADVAVEDDVGVAEPEVAAEPINDVAEAAPAVPVIADTPNTPEDSAAPEAPATPAILAVTGDGVEVVQPAVPADTPPEVMSTVALDTITYDPEGDVVLGGRALGQGFVQVYVDNVAISRLPVDADGRWRGDLPDVDTGVYTLRIDEVDVAGDVVSRIETPFLREDPDDVIAAMADAVDNPDFTIATRTVQAGTTLWAIAEERYGSGVLYVNVFEANKDRIRDPDLIYPGQVFTLPEDDS